MTVHVILETYGLRKCVCALKGHCEIRWHGQETAARERESGGGSKGGRGGRGGRSGMRERCGEGIH